MSFYLILFELSGPIPKRQIMYALEPYSVHIQNTTEYELGLLVVTLELLEHGGI